MFFLEFPCFLCDPANVANLTSGSCAFSKPSLYIWNFSVHVLWKPSLKDFAHNLTSMQNEHNYMIVWAFFGIAFLWNWNETDLSQSCGHCWVLQICWHTECSIFTVKSSGPYLGRITTNKAGGGDGIPVALFQILKDDAVHVPIYNLSLNLSKFL